MRFFQNLQYSKSKEAKQQAVLLNPNDARALFELGVMESKMGNYKDALLRYLKVLEIRRKEYGENHSEIADICGAVSEIYYLLGDYEKALEILSQGFEE